MKFMKLLLSFFTLSAFVYATDFQKDEVLLDALHNKKLIVIRQAESLNNELDVVTSSPSPGYTLTQHGRVMIYQQARSLKGTPIEVIYCSPLYRALQSTEIVGKVYKLHPNQLIPDQRLTMQNFGIYEGQDFDVYKQIFSSQTEMLESSVPEGEPGALVFQRTRDFLYSLSNISQHTIVIITHAFNICHIRMCLLGEYGVLPEPGEIQIFDFIEASP